jgi:hypothetical protein
MKNPNGELLRKFPVGVFAVFWGILLLTRTQLRACAVRHWMFIFWHAPKNEPRKRAKGSDAPWNPASVKTGAAWRHMFLRAHSNSDFALAI